MGLPAPSPRAPLPRVRFLLLLLLLPSPSLPPGRGHAARLHRPPELPRPGEGHPALLQRLWPPARGRPQKRVSAVLRAGSRPADASSPGPRVAFPSRAGRAAPDSPPPPPPPPMLSALAAPSRCRVAPDSKWRRRGGREGAAAGPAPIVLARLALPAAASGERAEGGRREARRGRRARSPRPARVGACG